MCVTDAICIEISVRRHPSAKAHGIQECAQIFVDGTSATGHAPSEPRGDVCWSQPADEH